MLATGGARRAPRLSLAMVSLFTAGASGTASTIDVAALPLITSSANTRVKMVRKLAHRRQRKRSGLIVLEGRKLVGDALDAGLCPEFAAFADPVAEEHAPLAAALSARLAGTEAGLFRVPASLFEELSDTETPQGVLAVLRQPALPLPEIPDLVLVCDAISDPGNLGTLLRSAAGAGAHPPPDTHRPPRPRA